MPCVGECFSSSVVCKQLRTGQDDVWFQPRSVEDLLGNIRQVPEHETYRLVGGNTGTGVYDDGGPFKYFIDVTKIQGPDSYGIDFSLRFYSLRNGYFRHITESNK